MPPSFFKICRFFLSRGVRVRREGLGTQHGQKKISPDIPRVKNIVSLSTEQTVVLLSW